MAEFEIGIWFETELWMTSGEPMKWCKEYIKENIERDTSHTVSIYDSSDGINYPADTGSADYEWPGYYEHPCPNIEDEAYFKHGGEWWEEYHSCNGLYDAADANLLVIDHDGSWGVAMGASCGESRCCLAEGHRVGNFDSIEEEGCGMKYAQMFSTVLHEIGHVITPGSINGYDDEKIGNAEYKNGNNYSTPMATEIDPNACGHDNGYNSSGDECWAREYSQCLQENMSPRSERDC